MHDAEYTWHWEETNASIRYGTSLIIHYTGNYMHVIATLHVTDEVDNSDSFEYIFLFKRSSPPTPNA